MTTINLAGLLAQRDESLRTRPAPFLARWARRVRAIDLRPAWRVLVILMLGISQFALRHGLVLAACTAFVVGAATLSTTAAWITAACALFFLEARRR